MRVRHPHRLEAQVLRELDLLDDFRDGLGGEDAQIEFHAGIIAEANRRLTPSFPPRWRAHQVEHNWGRMQEIWLDR
jgi:hypothetical protein